MKRHRIIKIACVFVLSQLVMLLVLNNISLGACCEWAKECREWVETL